LKGHGEKLSRKQEQAIAALLTCPTIEQAAKAAGVGETTLWRWLQDSDKEIIISEELAAALEEIGRQD